jgi:tripartite-type tricarboxylate transporter receptor subunit TctC
MPHSVTRRPRVAFLALLGLALAAGPGPAGAQAPASAGAASGFPAKPVRLVVAFPPAGATDLLARAVAADLQHAWNQSVVIENRPGAGGNLGTDLVAKAAPDGYTLVMGTVGTHAINVSLYRRMPYDAVRDFAPVALVARVPNLLVVNPELPVRSVADLIAYARAHPDALNYASSGNGTSIHLSGELFKSMTGVLMTHVPFNGSGPAIASVIGGQTQLMFDNMPSALPHARSGKLRAIAVTTPSRSPAVPDIPTIAESGVPGYDASSWFGILAPAGTPHEVVMKIHDAIVQGLHSPQTAQLLANQGAEAVGNSPEQFGAFIQAEIAKWARVVQAAHAQVD